MQMFCKLLDPIPHIKHPEPRKHPQYIRKQDAPVYSNVIPAEINIFSDFILQLKSSFIRWSSCSSMSTLITMINLRSHSTPDIQ